MFGDFAPTSSPRHCPRPLGGLTAPPDPQLQLFLDLPKTDALIFFLHYPLLDDGNIDCGVFVGLQKAFDTADHQILLAKLNHYGSCGVSNDSFKSYLSNVSINGYDYGLPAINCGILQGSVLGTLLFLLYIVGLN